MTDETSPDIKDSVKDGYDYSGPGFASSGASAYSTNKSLTLNRSLVESGAEASPGNKPNSALSHLVTLIEDYHSFNTSQPPVLPYPTPVDFSKQVSKGLPAVYSLPSSRYFCPAQSWNRSYLLNAIKQTVEVAVTPDGRADSLQHIDAEKVVFLQPASVQMTLSQLLDKFDHPEKSPVYYLQSQNGNLSSDTPLAPLLVDLHRNISFAQDVLGPPEAINIWIGTSASITSTHRDPYENLYLVLKGRKTFTLFAPVDEVALYVQHVRTGRYEYHTAMRSFSIAMDDGCETIPWVPIDVRQPRDAILQTYPLYRFARPQRVTVAEGQILYLPAGWFHHVEQEGGTWDDGTAAPCIAVNYWYDQDYEGEKYAMRQHVGRLAQQVREELSSKEP